MIEALFVPLFGFFRFRAFVPRAVPCHYILEAVPCRASPRFLGGRAVPCRASPPFFPEISNPVHNTAE